MRKIRIGMTPRALQFFHLYANDRIAWRRVRPPFRWSGINLANKVQRNAACGPAEFDEQSDICDHLGPACDERFSSGDQWHFPCDGHELD
jgi:hypothetical protein